MIPAAPKPLNVAIFQYISVIQSKAPSTSLEWDNFRLDTAGLISIMPIALKDQHQNHKNQQPTGVFLHGKSTSQQSKTIAEKEERIVHYLPDGQVRINQWIVGLNPHSRLMHPDKDRGIGTNRRRKWTSIRRGRVRFVRRRKRSFRLDGQGLDGERGWRGGNREERRLYAMQLCRAPRRYRYRYRGRKSRVAAKIEPLKSGKNIVLDRDKTGHKAFVLAENKHAI